MHAMPVRLSNRDHHQDLPVVPDYNQNQNQKPKNCARILKMFEIQKLCEGVCEGIRRGEESCSKVGQGQGHEGWGCRWQLLESIAVDS